MIKAGKSKHSQLSTCSFDKGFHSPDNQTELAKLLETVALPRKGKLSKIAKAKEHTKAYRQAKDKHSAVESAINALEIHGLDRCPDHGIVGFKRYAALAVVARNIQRLGVILLGKEIKAIVRKNKRQKKILHAQAA